MGVRPQTRVVGRRWAVNLSHPALAILIRVASAFLSTSALLGSQLALAQPAPPPTWELRICADQDNLPYSNRAGDGFENRLARLLAGDLGASAAFAWMPLPRQETDGELMLGLGQCDVLMSVVDGQEPYLNTISYYTQAAYFVTLTGRAAPTSLNDPQLATARVGVNRGGPLDLALQSRVPLENLQHFTSQQPPTSILDAVIDGAIDVGIAWGPAAGYFTTALGLPLDLTPVTPAFDMPFLSLTQPMTMGVRRGDEALRDALNRSLARQWDDVQLLLDDLHVARPATPPPSAGPLGAALPDELRLGLVVPAQAGHDPRLADNAEAQAAAARKGALLAEETTGEVPVRLFMASAPDAATAERATRRLAAVDGVAAIVGGIGEGQALRLAQVAKDLGLPLVNVADLNPALRSGSCDSATFSVAPGADDYFAAMAAATEAAAIQRLFVVYPGTPYGEMITDHLKAEFDGHLASDWSAGNAAVQPGQPYFGPEFDQIHESGPDGVLLLLDADAQLVFLGQYASSGLHLPVFSLATGGTLLRQFYWTAAHDAFPSPAAPRFAAWDAALAGGTFATDYLARWGNLPDAVAWQAFTSIRALQQAAGKVVETGVHPERVNGAELLASLRRPGSGYRLDDGTTVEFDPATQQLLLPIYALSPIALGQGEYKTSQLMEVTGFVLPDEPSGEGASGCATRSQD